MKSPPKLHAVIESPTDAPAFVEPLPTRPWPSHVRLSARTPDTDVALVVAQLARYGHGGSGPRDLASLVNDFPRVAPGGIAACDELQDVHPSCCCGLEKWHDWNRVITAGEGPWLGHDPAPWVELRDGDVLVWPDGGLVDVNTEGMRPVWFSRAQFEGALRDVETDLRDFIERLREWATPRSPELAARLAERFAALVGMDVAPADDR